METEEERRARLENDAATKRFRLARRRTKKEKQDWRRWYVRSYHTASSGWPWRQRKKEEQKLIGFDLDLIWIEIGVLK